MYCANNTPINSFRLCVLWCCVACASVMCSNYCPLGYLSDDNGCHTCDCVPPSDQGIRYSMTFRPNFVTYITGSALAQHSVNVDTSSHRERPNFDSQLNRNPWVDLPKVGTVDYVRETLQHQQQQQEELEGCIDDERQFKTAKRICEVSIVHLKKTLKTESKSGNKRQCNACSNYAPSNARCSGLGAWQKKRTSQFVVRVAPATFLAILGLLRNSIPAMT